MHKFDDSMIVCRCEEISVGEIVEAISQGARDVTGIKRRTRAGMGLCQGRTCELLVQQILRAELGNELDFGVSTPRIPQRPVKLDTLGSGEL